MWYINSWIMVIVDNAILQTELLHFITSVLTVDHPKHARQLRTSLLIIKVK